MLISNIYFNIPVIYYVFLVLIWITITSIGSFHIRWNYHLKALHSLPSTTKKQVAITFDDGPNPEFTPQVLDLLKQFNAKATFFCIGQQVEKHPELIKQINEQGHTIGNHSFSHSNTFGFFKTNTIIEELEQTDALFKTKINKQPLLFRPPFGVTNPAIAKAIKKTKHQVIGWNIRSLDTVIKSEEKIIKRVTKRLHSGSVILLHDTSEKSIIVLEQLLLFLQEQGYQSVTVDTLFNLKAYA